MNKQYPMLGAAALATLAALMLSACGGGSTEKGRSSAANSGAALAGPPPGKALSLGPMQFAQTHVLPEAGLQWKNKNGEEMGSLHLTGQRDTLVMVDLKSTAPQNPVLEAWLNNQKLGQISLLTPDKLSPTEDGGSTFASNLYSAVLPANMVLPGVALRVVADNFSPSDFKKPEVGADTDLDMWIVPMYLFGANDANTFPYAVTGNPDKATYQELYAKWPVSRLNVKNHPVARLDWPYIIIAPNGTDAAYRVDNKDQQKEGYAIMNSALLVLEALQVANGETSTHNQMYAPLLMLGADGQFAETGGGYGGATHATGDHLFSDTFIHEVGHGFGMAHAGEAYAAGAYPYVAGSLLGSAWGYDSVRKKFLGTLVPRTAQNYADACLNEPERIKDSLGRCVKQDPMQGGDGDQSSGDHFSMFSDFHAGLIQQFFEGKTTLDSKGKHQYQGGRIFVDSKFASGYSRWDSIDKKRVGYTPLTDLDADANGFDNGFPSVRNVAVRTIIWTHSLASTANVAQIYPLAAAYQGNLRRYVDPTNASQVAEIHPDSGKYFSYCHQTGCDFTLRISYQDGSVQHIMLQQGRRPPGDPRGASPASYLDPKNGDSFKMSGINISAAKTVRKIELLDTPMAWNGIGKNPRVLTSRSL
ncbi:M66 family metalloprotease [Undibacterium sp. JH2W]|uniref:M66 family metalloprotease n=1 Tax=Undibacterium sp. JH2W TaxID=3413037 RepID=UPI003BF14193